MSINQSTDLLAKLLATENITVKQAPEAKTAMFDLKNRVLILPVWHNISNDLRDMLVVHEVGHALDTPIQGYRDAYEGIAKRVYGDEVNSLLTRTVAGFLNVIEDARIDKRQKRRYPGTRKNYLIGYKELIERDFFGTSKRDINQMSFIDKANIYFKGGFVSNRIQFDAIERAFLARIEALETWDATVALTEEIYLFCKKRMEEQMLNIEELINVEVVPGEDDDDDGSYGDYWDELDAGEGDETDAEGNSGEGDSEEDEGDLGRTRRGRSTNENDTGAGERGAGQNNNAPRSETDEAWEKNAERIVQNDGTSYIYCNLPEIDLSQAVNDYKVVLKQMAQSLENYFHGGNGKHIAKEYELARKSMTAWKMKEKDAISFMVKEFETRKSAELYSRISIAKTGVIDTNKLHSYKYNDDIFRRLATIPKGKNHGFVMFLDWSGSMHPELKQTIKQLITLTMFCKQIQVPFEVYSFKDTNAGNPFFPGNKENCVSGNHVVLRNILSSRMNNEEMMRMYTNLWFTSSYMQINSDTLSGTPLNECLMIAPYVVNEFRKKNKCEIVNTIVITDGDSNGGGRLVNSTEGRSAAYWRGTRYFYVDPITKKTYDFHPHNAHSFTEDLLKILKDRTDSNVIGFFLFNGTFGRIQRRWSLQEDVSKAKKFWHDNKFYPVTTAGYDQYYIIDCEALRNSRKESELQIDKTKNNNHIAKAFAAYSAKKTVNRVLLRQFVEKISKTDAQRKAKI